MASIDFKRGRDELTAARRDLRGLLFAAFFFSIFVNLLMLTGPLYMLQVYDRVLGSRSEATLWALSALMAVMYLAMGLLDFARGRIMARIGADGAMRARMAAAEEEVAAGRIGPAAAASQVLDPILPRR